MRAILLALVCAISLSGCLPMAIFASSSDPAYRGKSNSWGTVTASSEVNAFCISPKLRLIIWDFEGRFGRKVIMQSGYRDNYHNGQAGGADGSYHMKCMAADFYIPGVPKGELIAFAMNNDGVGGLGCYPGRSFIHVDIRDRPRGYNRPVTFSGC
ncbi:YcbK family protein [Paradevosia shaoguanensis]|uniref:D-Ala-D-Ala carboxypeptidase family metallohydrolase n=1 Tax=Paradevosia shaoguanensis TaxID=1335043 RepID=A0AA41QMF2_9HYPH|nr:D-Ala-D-Ala carboxypeptidase family metallohydrolase [Paradevosia shaoguanensis]MCF1742345.1 D-Ala-D-Ala carboxypeptidase family metallohydrolase [Paradevosia shaoguanensis]MCI0126828.1 D-Ala-D-Ala carboxypeptidase family metallohydrolase [Paradevosia shaoguanensis]